MPSGKRAHRPGLLVQVVSAPILATEILGLRVHDLICSLTNATCDITPPGGCFLSVCAGDGFEFDFLFCNSLPAALAILTFLLPIVLIVSIRNWSAGRYLLAGVFGCLAGFHIHFFFLGLVLYRLPFSVWGFHFAMFVAAAATLTRCLRSRKHDGQSMLWRPNLPSRLTRTVTAVFAPSAMGALTLFGAVYLDFLAACPALLVVLPASFVASKMLRDANPMGVVIAAPVLVSIAGYGISLFFYVPGSGRISEIGFSYGAVFIVGCSVFLLFSLATSVPCDEVESARS